MKTHAHRLIGAVTLMALLIVGLPGPLQGTDSGQTAPKDSSGISVREFLTPDGRFDLEAARRSSYQGSLNMKGFTSAFDTSAGQSVFRPASPALGSGLDSAVVALAVYGNELMAGGSYTTTGCTVYLL